MDGSDLNKRFATGGLLELRTAIGGSLGASFRLLLCVHWLLAKSDGDSVY